MEIQIPDDLKPGDKVLVSACLVGEEVLWDGGHDLNSPLLAALKEAGAEIVPVCPEMLGGLPCPRPAAEPLRGDGRDVLAGRVPVLGVEDGSDMTAEFLEGAWRVVEIAAKEGARFAFLNERSPSCGVRQCHSGGGVAEGPGVATAALEAAGVRVLPGRD